MIGVAKNRGRKPRRDESSKNDHIFAQNKNPFPRKWMNSCFQKLIYPNANSIEVMEKVSETLPRLIIKPQTSELKQQALFLLLGEAFTEHHFPKHKFNPEILNSPKIQRKQKEKYIEEMKTFLEESLVQAMKDSGFPRDFSKYKQTDDKLGRYQTEIRGTFKDAFITNITLEVFGKESKEINKNSSLKRGSSDSDGKGIDEEGGLGLTYSPEANVAAQMLLDLIASNDNKHEAFKKQLRERHLSLPLNLRHHFWWTYLVRRENESAKYPLSGDSLKEAMIKDFEDKLRACMKKQKLRVATKSSNANAIDSHVIESSPPLNELDNDSILMTTTLALNMADIYSNNYSPVVNFLLFPFQLTTKNKDAKKDEYIKHLALQLTLFSKYAQLTPGEIFKLSEEVIDIIEREDKEYLDHVKKCLSIQSNKAKPMDFLPEVFIRDTKAGLEVFNALVNRVSKAEDEVRENYSDELTDPAIFIRKWIGQLFVGILSINGMLWAWDQLFLNAWSHHTIKNIALSIFALIKPWMMRATMFSGARKVFIEEPSKLYTSDLRTALNCLDDGHPFSKIPPTKNFVVDDHDARQKSSIGKPSRAKVGKLSSSRDRRRGSFLKPFTVPVLPFGSKEDFRLDLDLSRSSQEADESEEDLAPVREPQPDSESDPEEEEPPRVRDPNEPPTPPDSPPPPLTTKGWVSQDPNPVNPPQEAGPRDPFDFYIDYVRFLPDNVRVCKVTVRLLNSNLPKGGFKPVVTFPLLDSYQRAPTFKTKQVVNPKGKKINPDCQLLLKLYGYQERTRDVVSVGSCLLFPFVFAGDRFLLRAGGHQIRIRQGAPGSAEGLGTFKDSDINQQLPIPGLTICVRLLKSDRIYDPTPRYEEGYYDSQSAKPSNTELRLFYHYIHAQGYRTWTVGDELRKIEKTNQEQEQESGPKLQRYFERLLDHATLLKKTRVPLPELDYSSFAKYDVRRGFNVCIQGAFGLPEKVEGFYLHSLGEVWPGRDAKSDVTQGSSTNNLQVVTRRIDLTSYQRSPDWFDQKTTLYPSYDEESLLLIQIFGIRVKYIPSLSGDSGSQRGEIVEAERGSFKIDYHSPLGWSVVPLFRDQYVQSGLHFVPVFKGVPKSKILTSLGREGSVKDGLKEAVIKNQIEVEKNSLMEVKVYDGHVELDDLPEEAFNTHLIALGIKDSALSSRQAKYKTKFADFVLENMDPKLKDLGTSGSVYEKESFQFQREANLQFILSLNNALEKVGKPTFSIES